MGRTMLVSLALTALLAACGSDADAPPAAGPAPTPERTPSASPSPSPTITAHPSPTLISACPNEAEARSDQTLRQGGSVTGDVDGDGTAEEVWVATDASGGPGCVAFLVVRRQDDSLLSTPLPFQDAFGSFDPRVHSLVDLGPAGGFEISVFVGAGASTQFVAIYAVSGDLVVQVRIRGRDEPLGSIFGTGGSVGHLDAVDCIEGHLINSTATPSGEGVEYEVRRRDYVLDGIFLVQQGKPQRDRIDLDELSAYPEFASTPLGSCPHA